MILKIIRFVIPDRGKFSIAYSKFGDVYDYIPSDTFWSALVNVISAVDGDNSVKEFIEKCKNDKIIFSSGFPYYVLNGSVEYFLPFPHVPLCHLDIIKFAEYAFELKKIKRRRWLSVRSFSKIQNLLQVRNLNVCFDFDKLRNILKCGEKFENNLKVIFKKGVSIRNSVDRLTNNANPYPSVFVSVNYSLSNNKKIEEAGIYFIVLISEDSMDYFQRYVLRYLHILSKQGIGGRRSYGYGFFESVKIFERDEDFPVVISFVKGKEIGPYKKLYYVNFSMLVVNESSIRKFVCGKIRNRGGYITYINPKTALKPRFYAFEEGSVFEGRVLGNIVEINYNGLKIYHYGKTILAPMGVGAS